MNVMIRLIGALSVATLVAAVGVLVFDALDLGGLAWLGLLLVAMVAGSLVDRERFYGPSDDERATPVH